VVLCNSPIGSAAALPAGFAHAQSLRTLAVDQGVGEALFVPSGWWHQVGR
jgi:hypothetical protein